MLLVNPKISLEEWTYYTRLIPASSSPLAAGNFDNSLNERGKKILTLLPTFFFLQLLDSNTLLFFIICINIFHNCSSATSKVTCLSSLETKMFLETLPNVLEGLLPALFLMEIMQLESEKWLSTGLSTCYFKVVFRSHAIMTQYWKILKLR